MVSNHPTVWLVSGANRGIGLGIVTEIAAKPDTVVFAGARNPSAAKDLHALADKYPGKLHVVKLVSGDRQGNDAAVEEIKRLAGRLDVVVANAGVLSSVNRVLDESPEAVREHMEVNLIGTLVLFQATYPLLVANTKSPKFIPVSSYGGSITLAPPLGLKLFAYSASKAALNWMARKLHYEHESDGLVVFPLNPGAVDTGMTVAACAKDDVLAQAEFVPPEVVAGQIVTLIDGATRESAGGQFMNHDGNRLEW
ncbi:NAD(P)-binding protein [Punctularia strigosozonata HHB-11173 SS5]|uniref:NAD(P)-binding protein n=1 Tax=Punctularia strigosozonata (strain HHB-11173) TaxID=741275 RepID=UPI0004416E13|nr:NAD(P)-binding protein [Punctularia strigosozonata HHB-11173 SS5]EIN06161.1 NAD(P)-binding protein [Punctularia strigosozonata HHB-11173 SS5]